MNCCPTPPISGMDLAIPIFAFHRVGPRTGGRFTVPTEIFERYLTIIEDEGYSTLTCSDLASVVLGRATPPWRACVLTFDDGAPTSGCTPFPC